MEIRELAISGAWVFTPVQHGDARGCSSRRLSADAVAADRPRPRRRPGQRVGLVGGHLRGIHFADVPPGQAKYVTCVAGAILDVIVDIRVGSPTFGRYDAVLLDDTDRRAVYLVRAWATRSARWPTGRR